MASENIVTGKKYRILTNAVSKIWDRVSFWTKSTDVEFNDGVNAEMKMGALKGITSDIANVTVSGYAADAKAVSELNNSLDSLKTMSEWKLLGTLNSTSDSLNLDFNYREIGLFYSASGYWMSSQYTKEMINISANSTSKNLIAPSHSGSGLYKNMFLVFSTSGYELKVSTLKEYSFPVYVYYK